MSFDRLIQKIRETGCPVVLGLDPALSSIPPQLIKTFLPSFEDPLEGMAEAVFAWNAGLINALYDILPAVKPQAAYYEQLGWQGMRTLARTIAYARDKGLFVIMDGKRNDIGSTVEAYATAYLGELSVGEKTAAPFGADALTVNGYLGTDGIAPFLTACKSYDKGIFVLCKTSNPSSGELQDQLLNGNPLYNYMGKMCEMWGDSLPGAFGYSGVGAVVGATYPSLLRELRAALPRTFFLVPGYGAQGGGAADVAGAFDKNGGGAIINASRSILCAWQKETAPENYREAARKEVLRMKEDIARAIG